MQGRRLPVLRPGTMQRLSRTTAADAAHSSARDAPKRLLDPFGAALPDEVTPRLHRAFFSWIGVSSTVQSTQSLDDWTRKSALKRFSHAEWQRKATARGIRRVPAGKEAVVHKLLGQFLTVSDDAADPATAAA